MEKYSHGEFQVTGQTIRTTNKDGKDILDIKNLWEKFMSEHVGDKMQHKVYPHIHMVYFNYANTDILQERQYDVLIGYVTKEGLVQDNTSLTTVIVPAQDYQYVKFTDASTYHDQWQKVNNMSKEECNRAFGYDMDMYSEDMGTVTLAVSVHA